MGVPRVPASLRHCRVQQMPVGKIAFVVFPRELWNLHRARLMHECWARSKTNTERMGEEWGTGFFAAPCRAHVDQQTCPC